VNPYAPPKARLRIEPRRWDALTCLEVFDLVLLAFIAGSSLLMWLKWNA